MKDLQITTSTNLCISPVSLSLSLSLDSLSNETLDLAAKLSQLVCVSGTFIKQRCESQALALSNLSSFRISTLAILKCCPCCASAPASE